MGMEQNYGNPLPFFRYRHAWWESPLQPSKASWTIRVDQVRALKEAGEAGLTGLPDSQNVL